MHHGPITHFTSRLATTLLLSLPLAAGAEPVGEMLPLNETAEAMMVFSGETVESMAAAIPSQEAVGLPVYPESFYASKFEAEGMLSAVTIASKDPMEEVKAWYEQQDALTWSDDYGFFYVGDEYEMMKSETVFLQDISADPQESAGGMSFDMNGMKTQITISYKPRTKE